MMNDMVNPILKDRIYKMKQLRRYKVNDKKIIAKKYLLPIIREKSKFNETDIIIDDKFRIYIINNLQKKKQVFAI